MAEIETLWTSLRRKMPWRVVWAWKWLIYFVKRQWRGAPDGW